MTNFRRALFGYRRPEVDAAIAARDSRIAGLEEQTAVLGERNSELEAQGLVQVRALAAHEADLSSLSAMVVERERTIRDLLGRLEEANSCHDRSITALDKVSARLEELQAQARGQATRIRMKALRDAVEVGQRAAELGDAEREEVEPDEAHLEEVPDLGAEVVALEESGLYEGKVRLEIGPLGDFAQLVGFEDAVGRLGATDIAVERFSDGRATFSMRLDQPVDLLRELESLSDLDFKVRHTAPDNLILDVDEDGPERHAA